MHHELRRCLERLVRLCAADGPQLGDFANELGVDLAVLIAAAGYPEATAAPRPVSGVYLLDAWVGEGADHIDILVQISDEHYTSVEEVADVLAKAGSTAPARYRWWLGTAGLVTVDAVNYTGHVGAVRFAARCGSDAARSTLAPLVPLLDLVGAGPVSVSELAGALGTPAIAYSADTAVLDHLAQAHLSVDSVQCRYNLTLRLRDSGPLRSDMERYLGADSTTASAPPVMAGSNLTHQWPLIWYLKQGSTLTAAAGDSAQARWFSQMPTQLFHRRAAVAIAPTDVRFNYLHITGMLARTVCR